MRSADLKATSRACELRREATGAESKLWQTIRARQIEGHKFVRQEPIGLYFADFVCRAQRFNIEVDGETHSTPEELASDARRTAFLNELGYRVVRFTNVDVYESLDWVIERLIEALAERAPHPPTPDGAGPNPLPMKKGERD